VVSVFEYLLSGGIYAGARQGAPRGGAGRRARRARAGALELAREEIIPHTVTDSDIEL